MDYLRPPSPAPYNNQTPLVTKFFFGNAPLAMAMKIQPLMSCFSGMVDRPKAFSFISSRDYIQRSSPSQISDTPRAGFEPAQNLSSALVE